MGTTVNVNPTIINTRRPEIAMPPVMVPVPVYGGDGYDRSQGFLLRKLSGLMNRAATDVWCPRSSPEAAAGDRAEIMRFLSNAQSLAKLIPGARGVAIQHAFSRLQGDVANAVMVSGHSNGFFGLGAGKYYSFKADTYRDDFVFAQSLLPN